MNSLNERISALESEIEELKSKPYLLGYWLDRSDGYTRLRWFSSGKRRRSKQLEPKDVPGYRLKIKRGQEIKRREAALERIQELLLKAA